MGHPVCRELCREGVRSIGFSVCLTLLKQQELSQEDQEKAKADAEKETLRLSEMEAALANERLSLQQSEQKLSTDQEKFKKQSTNRKTMSGTSSIKDCKKI